MFVFSSISNLFLNSITIGFHSTASQWLKQSQYNSVVNLTFAIIWLVKSIPMHKIENQMFRTLDWWIEDCNNLNLGIGSNIKI